MSLLLVLVGATAAASMHATTHLRLATTTSTENSGLLAALLPPFEKTSGIKVDVIAVGSGKALKLAENGDVDVVLTHAPELEERFIASGFGVDKRSLMYDDFVIVGPPDDPARIRETTDPVSAFVRLSSEHATFISRGDESGTHQREKQLWRKAGIEPHGDWYVSAGLGMCLVLLMADEQRAYTLTDRGTFLAYKGRAELAIVYEEDSLLRNNYIVTVVNPKLHPHVKYREAIHLLDWLTSVEGQKIIGDFTVDGKVLFHPAATAPLSGDRGSP
jgi:tungstate transport system substrate-binding protein